MSEPIALHEDPELLVLRYVEDPRPEMRDSILLAFTSTVERIARKYSGFEAVEDLVQVGFIGLLNALGKFDPAAGVRFGTYASYLVAGEIKHYLRDRAQIIRQPAWLQEVRHKVNRATGVLQQTLGRTATHREIAEKLGINESVVSDVIATQELSKVASLDAAAPNDDDGETDVERLDAADFCPEQLSVEDRMLLEHALSQLREVERQVLVHFHFDSMNQTEIATRLGISCNYVSHILRQSLTKLRKILTEEAEKDRVLKREVEVADYDIMDSTIGAYTEDYFKTRLQEETHRASFEGSSVGVVLINFQGLDSLKRFYGAASVVDFLTDAAEFCRESVRRLDMVCRQGNTGFAIILPSTGQNVGLVRQRLVHNLQSWMSGRYAQGSPLSVDIGYASFPEQAKTALQLVSAAKVKPLTTDWEEAA